MKNKKGFTLIELLIVIALISLLGSLSVPFYNTFLVRNFLENKTSELTHTIKKAQNYTVSGKESSQWGVYMSQDSFVLYKGLSYISRDVNFDEQYSFPATLSLSGLTEINFAKLRGETSNTGTINVIANNGESHIITINKTGSININ